MSKTPKTLSFIFVSSLDTLINLSLFHPPTKLNKSLIYDLIQKNTDVSLLFLIFLTKLTISFFVLGQKP